MRIKKIVVDGGTYIDWYTPDNYNIMGGGSLFNVPGFVIDGIIVALNNNLQSMTVCDETKPEWSSHHFNIYCTASPHAQGVNIRVDSLGSVQIANDTAFMAALMQMRANNCVARVPAESSGADTNTQPANLRNDSSLWDVGNLLRQAAAFMRSAETLGIRWNVKVDANTGRRTATVTAGEFGLGAEAVDHGIVSTWDVYPVTMKSEESIVPHWVRGPTLTPATAAAITFEIAVMHAHNSLISHADTRAKETAQALRQAADRM